MSKKSTKRSPVPSNPVILPGVDRLTAALSDSLPVVPHPGLSDRAVEMMHELRRTLLWFEDRALSLVNVVVPCPTWTGDTILRHDALEGYSLRALLDTAAALCANLHRMGAGMGLSTTALVLAGTQPFPSRPPGVTGGLLRDWWAAAPTLNVLGSTGPVALLANRACQEMLCHGLALRLWLEISARLDDHPVYEALSALWRGQAPKTRELERFVGRVVRDFRTVKAGQTPRPPVNSFAKKDVFETVLVKAAVQLDALREAEPNLTFIDAVADERLDTIAKKLSKALTERWYRSRQWEKGGPGVMRLVFDPSYAAAYSMAAPPDQVLDAKDNQARWDQHIEWLISRYTKAPADERILRAIHQDPDATAKDIAEAAGVSKATFYRRLDLIVTMGATKGLEFLRGMLTDSQPVLGDDPRPAKRTLPKRVPYNQGGRETL